jgi:hypothetical protein
MTSTDPTNFCAQLAAIFVLRLSVSLGDIQL